MKVIGVDEFGGPEALKAFDIPERHAGPGEVRVRIRDNGHGRPAAPSHGLLGMRERATMYGGAMTAGPAENGWQIDVTLKEPA